MTQSTRRALHTPLHSAPRHIYSLQRLHRYASPPAIAANIRGSTHGVGRRSGYGSTVDARPIIAWHWGQRVSIRR